MNVLHHNSLYKSEQEEARVEELYGMVGTVVRTDCSTDRAAVSLLLGLVLLRRVR